MAHVAQRISEPNDPVAERNLEILNSRLEALGLPDEGKAYVVRVASSPPSRSVGESRKRNLIALVPIPHLGVVLQAESESGEHFFLLELSRERGLIGIYDQPEGIPVQITNKRGIKTRTTHTPDYLVVHQDRVTAYEVKNDGQLQALCRDRPCDWCHENGEYIYLSARNYFKDFGIDHRVIPNSAITSVRADNLRMLASVRLMPDTTRLRSLRKKAMVIAKRFDLVQIGTILDALDTEDATAIIQLIDQGLLHVNLDKCLLASIRAIWISVKQDLITAFDEHGFCLKGQLKGQCDLTTDEVPDPRHLSEVAARLATCGLIEVENLVSKKAHRTQRRWIANLKKSGGNPSALFPKWSRSGNRDARFSQPHIEFAYSIIESTKGDSNLSSRAGGYREYKRLLKKQTDLIDKRPMCRQTFYNWFERYRSQLDLALLRGGRRLSNATADSIDPLCRTILPTRAFMCAHFDHCLLDIQVVVGHSRGKPITKRPWLTVLVDGYTGEILGIWVSFRNPCRQSCAMAIRDCALRHGRLPEEIVVDGGPDLTSLHFKVMLATLFVTWINRPPEDPVFGKEVERSFGTFKERFIRGLPGFVSPIRDARKTSGKMSAANRADLSLSELIELYERYIFERYNHELGSGQFESRIALRALSDKHFPFSGRIAKLDTRFLILSAVDASASDYQFTSGRGIRIYDTTYSCPALLNYRGPKKRVRVKLETLDCSIIYVCVSGYWYVCRNSSAVINNALPRAEVIAQASTKRELRAFRNALAEEEQQASYEAKKEHLHEILERDRSARQVDKSMPGQSVTPPYCVPDQGPIEDLITDEDAS